MRFDGNLFTYQCEKENKGFQISHFCCSFSSGIMAVKGLRMKHYTVVLGTEHYTVVLGTEHYTVVLGTQHYTVVLGTEHYTVVLGTGHYCGGLGITLQY